MGDINNAAPVEQQHMCSQEQVDEIIKEFYRCLELERQQQEDESKVSN
jgi:hypothetical protein